MGAGSSAASGPSGYSLDQLLAHWSDKGELTAAKAAECTSPTNPRPHYCPQEPA